MAIRAGRVPEEPDNVVQPLVGLEAGLYVADSYIARRGDPRDGLEGHDFVGPEEGETGPPTYDWLRDQAIRYWYQWGADATSGGEGSARLLDIRPAMDRLERLDRARYSERNPG